MADQKTIDPCPIGHCCGGPCQEYGHGTHKAKHVVEAIHEALRAPPMSLDALRAACAIVDIAHETARAEVRADRDALLAILERIVTDWDDPTQDVYTNGWLDAARAAVEKRR